MEQIWHHTKAELYEVVIYPLREYGKENGREEAIGKG